MNIVILDAHTINPGDISWDKISSLGKITIYDRTSPEDIVNRCKDSEIVLTNKVILNSKTLLQLPKLKYIGILATGYNIIDFKQAKKQGILITNIPAYSTNSVAQMVFAHILNITNQIALHSISVKKGEWSSCKDFTYQLSPQIEIANKTIGIIGLGNIGMQVAMIANTFNMKIIALTSKKELPNYIKSVSKEELLKQSDFITLHCPLTDKTKDFINKDSLSKMKKTSILINTGRGPLINEKDLANALNNNEIFAAGIDVLTQEPPAISNPLIKAKNCYITPHIAWGTLESRKRLIDIEYKNIKNYLEKHPINVINL